MACHHIDGVEPVPAKTPDGCEECLEEGTPWVHLRLCLECGHVGCCDSSPGMHATKHFHGTGHPVMASYEPGERWGWCYVHEAELDVPARFEPLLR
ncbi:UBP-type zinc finger domain-containing protein [Isosphaeraceae bacterium EP7]